MSKRRTNNIRKIRESMGIKGKAIAEYLGISQQYYYDLEKGRRRLNIDHIIQLADYFKVSIDYLLGRSPENITVGNIYADLPELARKEIADYVDFIRQKYSNNQ